MILRLKNKTKLHKVFVFNIVFIFLWAFGACNQTYYFLKNGEVSSVWRALYFTGSIFIPVFLLYTVMLYIKPEKKIMGYHYIFAIPQIMLIVIYFLNPGHVSFIKTYSAFLNDTEYGKVFYVHLLISYSYLIITIIILLKNYIDIGKRMKNSYLLIFTGILFPFIFNIAGILGIIKAEIILTPVLSEISVGLFIYALFKYDFFNLTSMAFEQIADNISDGLIICDENHNIIKYNLALEDKFGIKLNISIGKSILNVFCESEKLLDISVETIEMIELCKTQKSKKSIEKILEDSDNRKHLKIEIIPIYKYEVFLGSIIHFIDITSQKESIIIEQKNQSILIERERQISLGNLIGGIAHNLKTPVFSMSGGIYHFNDAVLDYKKLLESDDFNFESHEETAQTMEKWIDRITPYTGYIKDILKAVNSQFKYDYDSKYKSFTVKSLVQNVSILMHQILKMNNCKLNEVIKLDENTKILGDMNGLIQVLDNLIINAMHSYNKKSGIINLIIKEELNNITLEVEDFGCGIPKEIKDNLFKKMITTKGSKGTGLGLYISNTIIKGYFNGQIDIISKKKGTIFKITIPK
jgi:two-component system sensor histidine kinase HupT/HoxJ